MKNKRWKREAKRMKVICQHFDDEAIDCNKCPIEKRCRDIVRKKLDMYIPCDYGIRELERLCKEDK